MDVDAGKYEGERPATLFAPATLNNAAVGVTEWLLRSHSRMGSSENVSNTRRLACAIALSLQRVPTTPFVRWSISNSVKRQLLG